jgi:hypothetical protein
MVGIGRPSSSNTSTACSQTGGIVVAGGVEGIAEVAEGVGFAVPVADVPAQVDGALVAGGRLLVLAEVVVGVAEAVPGGGLALAVADLL